jgi:hypothetical protein
MSDFEFVDPTTGAALGTHAFGTVAAGTASTAKAVRLRYKYGQTGSGAPSNALVMRVSENGGSTWRDAVTEFTLAVTAVSAPDVLYTERVRSLGRGTRWPLAPFRAGCYADLTLTFTPDKRTGAASTPLSWELGIDESVSIPAAFVPGAPAGVLSGIGDESHSEWITAPTLANGTAEVTLGDCAYVLAGVRDEIAGGDVALSQDDGDSTALGSGEEYVAVLSADGAGAVTVTKGSLATAGTATAPACPAGELPIAVVRVPYGGVIATSALVAVSGRCAVADAGGLDVTVQPGRVSVPGWLATPRTVQTLTLPDNAITTVRMGATGAASLTDGAPLAEVVTAAGDIVSVTDARRLLGLTEIRLRRAGDETAGTAVDSVYLPYPWAVDSGEVRVRTASTGATGSTDVAVELAGATFGSGSVAAQGSAAALTFTTFSGAAGWLTLDVAAVTSGGTRAADLEIVLWIARQ